MRPHGQSNFLIIFPHLKFYEVKFLMPLLSNSLSVLLCLFFCYCFNKAPIFSNTNRIINSLISQWYTVASITSIYPAAQQIKQPRNKIKNIRMTSKPADAVCMHYKSMNLPWFFPNLLFCNGLDISKQLDQ